MCLRRDRESQLFENSAFLIYWLEMSIHHNFFVKTHTTQYAELKKKKQYNWDILEKQYLIITMLCNFSKGKTWHSVNNINCTLVGFLPAMQLLRKECFVAC